MNKVGTIVIDTNIFAKLFLKENDSQKARQFLRKLTEDETQILVPSIFTYEVYYVAQRYAVDLDFVENLLTQYREYNLKEIALNKEIIAKTKEIIVKSSNPKSGYPSFYDSTYHSLAILNNCDFITSDRRHYKKTKEFGYIKLLSDIAMI